jgi:hypothetical protein
MPASLRAPAGGAGIRPDGPIDVQFGWNFGKPMTILAK